MIEYGNTILVKGRFRVVPILDDNESIKDNVVGYAVLGSEGDDVRREPSLDLARDWMEKLYYGEEVEKARTESPIKPRRGRR
jgi:hypothetical protein